MEHPEISRTLRTGYPKYSDRTKMYGEDYFKNEVYTGDEILVLDDYIYKVSELSLGEIEILENHGATYKIAE